MKDNNEIEKLKERVELLEDFIAELTCIGTGNYNLIERYVDQHERELWIELHLKKYPGNY